MSIKANGRFPLRTYAIVGLGVVAVAVLPIISVLTAGQVANANGCVLNESGVNPCLIGGADWGGVLAFMGVAGWFAFFTIPLGAVTLAVLLLVLFIHLLLSRRAADAG